MGMEPLAFDFSEPPVDPASVSPKGEALQPINGKTPLSRHASYTGAVHADETRSANIWQLRQLWRDPHTMQEIAAITKLPLSSVCSLKAALADELEAVDVVPVEWGEGRKPTRRTRWRIR